jgi:hypothetical protein
MPMRWTSTGVTRKRTQWSVQAQSDTGEATQLSFRTEAQARFFAAVLELGPSRLPSVSERLKERLARLPAVPPRIRSLPPVARAAPVVRPAPVAPQARESEEELVFSSVDEAL